MSRKLEKKQKVYLAERHVVWFWPFSKHEEDDFTLELVLHEKEHDKQWMSRGNFFTIACIASFVWALVPGYLFTTLSAISVLSLAFPKSVTTHQIGSGMKVLRIGSFTFDWSMIVVFSYSPLISPFVVTVNVAIGYALLVYIVTPVTYWGLNLYNATTLPIFSSHLFTSQGNKYNVSSIVNDKFELDVSQYAQQGRINLNMFFAVTYGIGFSTIATTLAHVALFHGKEIWEKFKVSRSKGKEGIHTRLMKECEDIPKWWFWVMFGVTILASLLLCRFAEGEVQMPWWALILACAVSIFFTLRISIITATTIQLGGLNSLLAIQHRG